MAARARLRYDGPDREDGPATMVIFYMEILCALLYGAASALAAHGILRARAASARAAKIAFLAAAGLHSVVIGIESVSTDGTLLSGPNIIMLASWVLAVVTSVGLVVTKRGLGFALAVGPVVALLIVASQWLKILDPAAADNMALYQWPLLVPHIVLVFVACACFAVSAAASGMLLYQRRLMARRSAKLFSLATPALDTLATIARWSALAGLVVFTGAMLIGFTHMVALSAAMAHFRCAGTIGYLWPRIVLSLLVSAVWSAYAALSFLAPCAVGTRTRALLSIGGFAAMIALIAVSAG